MIDEIVKLCSAALLHSTTENKNFYTCAAVLTFGALVVQIARYQLQQQYTPESLATKKGAK